MSLVEGMRKRCGWFYDEAQWKELRLDKFWLWTNVDEHEKLERGLGGFGDLGTGKCITATAPCIWSVDRCSVLLYSLFSWFHRLNF